MKTLKDKFVSDNLWYFDFRGLIENGLAIDATGKKIY